MFPLASELERQEVEFAALKRFLGEHGFSLGGNWDYRKGSFDRPLDVARTVWLRIPFETIRGHIDADADDIEANVRIGTPYVLKHVYRTGNDPEAGKPAVLGALVDQFQSPADPDADLSADDIRRAEAVLRETEAAWRGEKK